MGSCDASWGECLYGGRGQGLNSYYVTSDNSTMSYRTRIRTPTFAHLQQMPSVINGSLVSDAIIYLASIDIVMADCDR